MKSRAFTLLEMMVVVAIAVIIGAIAMVSFAGSRPSVQVKRDAAQMVSFLRNMWDRTKASNAPLILNPDYEKGKLSYFDPREGREFFAEFGSNVAIIGIRINDRFYTRDTYVPPMGMGMGAEGEGEGEEGMVYEDPAYYGDEVYGDTLYISEGRGLTFVGVAFAIIDEDQREETHPEMEYITMATLNLITGKGEVESLEQDMLDELMVRAEQEALEDEVEDDY